jgi:hypothetical protein
LNILTFSTFFGVIPWDFSWWAFFTWSFTNVITFSLSLFSKFITSWARWDFFWNANNAFPAALVPSDSFFFTWSTINFFSFWLFFLDNVPLAWTTQTVFVFSQSGESFDYKSFTNWVVFRSVSNWTMTVLVNIWNFTWLAVFAIRFTTDFFGFEKC